MREQPQYWSEERWRKETRKAIIRDMIVTIVLCALGISVLVWHSRNYGW